MSDEPSTETDNATDSGSEPAPAPESWSAARALKIGLAVVVGGVVTGLLVGQLVQRAGGSGEAERRMGAERVQGPAPAFQFVDPQGHPVTLESLRGKVVFLNFWATWCGPCEEEMPSLAGLVRASDAKDVVFLAAAEDDDRAPVDEWIAQQRPPFQVVIDPGFRAESAYGVKTYPQSFLIDRAGKLAYHFEGARDWSRPEAKALIENVLGR